MNLRLLGTLRYAPAMAPDVTDRLWSIETLLEAAVEEISSAC